MPSLAIIPATAVADTELTDTQIRVLCAIGTFTNRLGGNVWASVSTLAKACNLSTRTIQRAVPILVARGYLRRTDRPGRTPVYDVLLGVTLESPGGDTTVTPPPTTQSPKRYTERYNSTKVEKILRDEDFVRAMEKIWAIYPPRPEPYPYVAVRKAVALEAQKGVRLSSLINAAERYRQIVDKEQTDPRYVRSPVRFYGEEIWRQYAVTTVHGRTREEWARSGQDVLEFDRLARETGDE
jgi:Helix-turn-helix domain